MSITIPIWVLIAIGAIIGIPLLGLLLFCLAVGVVMIFGDLL